MIDITQSMACIHCGVCVGACLSLEVDPEFIGPAALAKAYRFVGDPRDGQTEERLTDLAEDPHGMYDCTHCFACIEVCPKDVAPMSQIMRLRRQATDDFEIKDRNNGYGHEKAFVDIIEKWGTLHEAQLLPRSFGDGSMVKGQIDAERRQAAGGEPAHRGPRPHVRQGHAEEGAAAPQAARPEERAAASSRRSHDRRTSASSSTSTSSARAIEDDGGRTRRHEARVLARLRLARLHPGAARLDGARGAQARPRAGRARPRQLLRRRRDRRAQPGAGGHPQRAHLRDGPGSRRGRGHDEHLLHLPGRPVGVPGAPRRRRRLPQDTSTGPCATRASPTSATASGGTRTSSGCSWRRSASTRSRRRWSVRSRGCASRPSTAATSSAPPSAWASTSTRTATSTSTT